MESLYGTDENVKARINHIEDHDGTKPDNFYMAHLDLIGKIVESEDGGREYNSTHAYGFLLERVMDFMKDQGYTFHGIGQFDDRLGEEPKMTVSFFMDAE